MSRQSRQSKVTSVTGTVSKLETDRSDEVSNIWKAKFLTPRKTREWSIYYPLFKYAIFIVIGKSELNQPNPNELVSCENYHTLPGILYFIYVDFDAIKNAIIINIL